MNGKTEGSVLVELLACFGLAAVVVLALDFFSGPGPMDQVFTPVRSVVAACGLALLLWKCWDAWRSR